MQARSCFSTEEAKARAKHLLEEMHAVLASDRALKALRRRSLADLGVDDDRSMGTGGGVENSGCCELL